MSDSQLDRIAHELRLVGSPGAFAARHRESALGLQLGIDGVGACRFPLTDDCVRELIRSAVPSPFGYRDQTLYDPSVRNSWEIPASRVHLDEGWAVRLQRGSQTVVRALGFPPDARITCTLQKLLVYAPGQFFSRHRDSEKEPGTAGTLVVVLPSTYQGGEIVVAHGGDEVRFDTADESLANQLSFVGFYVDCLHETRPVAAGHRVVLTYRLDVAPDLVRPVLVGDRLQSLGASVDAYFLANPDRWLVYLLEHQYSHLSIGWGWLKNGDRTRTDALRRAAESLGCECFLALATAVETYTLVEDEDPDEPPPPAPIRPERPWWRPAWPEAEVEAEVWPGDSLWLEPEPDVDTHLGTWGGRMLTLTHWVDARDQVRTGPAPEFEVDEDSVVTLADTANWSSHQAACEPWTGNEGGVAEKWFHAATLVLVPPDADARPEPAPPRPGVLRGVLEPGDRDGNGRRVLRRGRA